MAELFQTSVPNINLHLKAIYDEGELVEGATIKSYLIVRSEGSRQVAREVLHYSLPAILAVGYPPDFFDFIVVDECHRGGANDESNWRDILNYFAPAIQLGLTATDVPGFRPVPLCSGGGGGAGPGETGSTAAIEVP
ncbi:MAG: DEAD/DEAH box helicase family protein [Vicinamibacterales bacterium]|nr:DEAD/DEAH box helicase family protein [Vicinamibacterales bacterium]